MQFYDGNWTVVFKNGPNHGLVLKGERANALAFGYQDNQWSDADKTLTPGELKVGKCQLHHHEFYWQHCLACRNAKDGTIDISAYCEAGIGEEIAGLSHYILAKVSGDILVVEFADSDHAEPGACSAVGAWELD